VILDKIIKSNFLSLAVICALSFCAYSFMLDGSFKSMDDKFSIVENKDIRSFDNVKKIFTSSFFGGAHYYRPLVTLSFMIEYHFFELNPFYFRLTNLTLHLLMSATCFFLIFRLTKNRDIAFWTALLFAVHPVNSESVWNIADRSILLCALFSLNAILCFVIFRQDKKIWAMAASYVCFVLGLLAKESAAMVPIILISYCWLQKDALKRVAGGWIAGYFGFLSGFIILRKIIGITKIYAYDSWDQLVLSFFAFLRGGLTYLRLFVLPTDLYFDRARRYFENFADPQIWITLGVYAVLISLLVYYRKRIDALVYFFIFWACAELLPVSQIVTSIGVQSYYISLAEHFLYSASIGVFAVMVIAARGLYEKNKQRGWARPTVVRFGVAGAMVFFLLTTVQQNIYAKYPVEVYKRSIAHNPHNARVINALGMEYADRGDYKKAEKYFRQSLDSDPFREQARVALGKSLADQGRYWEAVQEYEKIKDIEEGSILDVNIALAYDYLIRDYKKRIQNDPHNAQLHYSLGVMLAKSKQYAKAQNAFHKAIELRPDYPEARQNLEAVKKLIETHD